VDSIENIRVSDKRAQTGFSAKQNRPPAIFGAGKIRRVGVVEYPSAEGDEFLRAGFLFNPRHSDKKRIASPPKNGGSQRQEDYFTSAINTSNGLTASPREDLVVSRRSALENRICRSWLLISFVREKSSLRCFSEKFRTIKIF